MINDKAILKIATHKIIQRPRSIRHIAKSTFMKKYYTLFFVCGCAIAGESVTHDELAKRLVRTGINSLIQQGVCSSYNSCTKEKHALYDRTESGAKLNFYGISDPQTARKLTYTLIADSVIEPCASIKINIYKADFRTVKSSLFKPEPLATAFLQGEEKCTR